MPRLLILTIVIGLAMLAAGCSSSDESTTASDWVSFMKLADSAAQNDDLGGACRYAVDAALVASDSGTVVDSTLIAALIRGAVFCDRAQMRKDQLAVCSVAVELCGRLTEECSDLMRGAVQIETANALFRNHAYEQCAQSHHLGDSLIRSYSDYDSLFLRSFQVAGATAMARGDWTRAEDCYTENLKLTERYLDPNSLSLASGLASLATVLTNQGKHGEALGLYGRIDSILAQHESLISQRMRVFSHRSQARILLMQGRPWEAEASELRSLAHHAKYTDKDDPSYTSGLDQLGEICMSIGALDKAEELLRKALEGRRKMHGARSLSVAHTLDKFATLRADQGFLDEADSLLKERAWIIDSFYAANHPIQAGVCNRYARLYLAQGRFHEADSVIQRALSIRSRRARPNSMSMGFTLALGAAAKSALGHDKLADSLYGRSRSILAQHFPDWHPITINMNLYSAIFKAKTGQYDESLRLFEKAMSARRSFARYGFSLASERQKLDWIAKNRLVSRSFLTTAVQLNQQDWTKSAFELLLNAKGVVIDNVISGKRAAFCSADPEVSRLIRQQKNVSSSVASLALSGLGNQSPTVRQDSLSALCQSYDDVERALSRVCSEVSDHGALTEISYDDLVNALPDSSSVVEIYCYDPFDFTYPGTDFKTEAKPRRYLALVLNSRGECNILDLGEASLIDSLVESALDQIEQAQSHMYQDILGHDELLFREISERLRDIVFSPIESLIGSDSNLFVCPDGALNLLPFEVFSSQDGSYLVENYQISYINCTRDLISWKNHDATGSGPVVVFASPEYDSRVSDDETAGDDRYQGCLSGGFADLPYTRDEADSVEALFLRSGHQELYVKTGIPASEENLKNLEVAPYVLHMATHGFICPDLVDVSGYSGVGALVGSGLALSGANQIQNRKLDFESENEDGIVTALEISGLDLRKTDLVVLSACRTGSGKTVNGEGVFGLRRAFQAAGAGSLLLSSWDVPDEATAGFMTSFYRSWLAGSGKSTAVRQALLAGIKDSQARRGTTHPLLWAGFTLVGRTSASVETPRE